jgi:TRAP-type mannitol/chloroaromatic compound transport system permease small subunit
LLLQHFLYERSDDSLLTLLMPSFHCSLEYLDSSKVKFLVEETKRVFQLPDHFSKNSRMQIHCVVRCFYLLSVHSLTMFSNWQYVLQLAPYERNKNIASESFHLLAELEAKKYSEHLDQSTFALISRHVFTFFPTGCMALRKEGISSFLKVVAIMKFDGNNSEKEKELIRYWVDQTVFFIEINS